MLRLTHREHCVEEMCDVSGSTIHRFLRTRKLRHGVTERDDDLLTLRVSVRSQPFNGLDGVIKLGCEGHNANVVHVWPVAVLNLRRRDARLNEVLFVGAFLLTTNERTFTMDA